MKPSVLSALVKISIIVFGVCGLLICIFAYSEQVTLATLLGEDRIPTPEESEIIKTQVIFYRAVSLPCFFVLALFWKLTGAIKENTVFGFDIARLFKICSLVLLADVALLIIGNTVMSCLGWRIFFVIKIALPIAGIIAVIALYLLSYFINEAAKLKEEAAGTV